jgi:DNA modification methylase
MKQTKFDNPILAENQDSPTKSQFSYSGDKPNPNLRSFVEVHVRGRPYDPEGDDYDVKAFDKPITTTKATAIYNMHTYWSKKPHNAIIEYVQHYTKPGDLVLDPMCGSGGTALAALMEGRQAVAIDVSPAATFITKNYCTPVDINELEEAFEELTEKVRKELDWLYETRCDGCGGKATTLYTVYSQRFQCPRCLEIVPLFDCVEAKVPAKTKQKGKPAELKVVQVCPHCKAKGHPEEISTRTKQFGSVPVLVSYECLGSCKPKRRQRQYNDADRKKREFFEKYDLGKIAEIESKPIPYWYPPHRMMNVQSDTAPWGDEWRPGRDFRTVAELFTKRNLWAVSILFNGINHLDVNDCYRDWLRAGLSGIVLGISRMNRYRPDVSFPLNIMNGTYYLPQISKEEFVFKHFENKIKRIIIALKSTTYTVSSNSVLISTDDAKNALSILPISSVDYVFTDPPYGGNVQYGELNFIWEAWLGLDTSWHEREIIVNETRGVTASDWRNRMEQTMGEVFRVLKPGRWVSLCYHDTSEGTWQLLQDLMTEVGFFPQQTDKALYIDTGQKSFNQVTADKVTKRDLVFNYRKPKPGESSSFLLLTGEEDARSFNQKACAVIRDFLLENPGSTKDRVYDVLVSHMVSRSQMQAHDFGELLRLVAESASAGGSGVAERWYLKDSELDFADVAETAKEDAAAQNVKVFIEKYLKGNPEFDGVHYSDVFEHYLYSVKDKPRRELKDWLLDYFFVTGEGTYRAPITEEEEQFKLSGRVRGLNRKIKRLAGFIVQGLAVPDGVRPDDLTLAEWILHSRRAGLYLEGKLLFERAGLVLDGLSEEMQVEVEEAYQTCNKMITKK